MKKIVISLLVFVSMCHHFANAQVVTREVAAVVATQYLTRVRETSYEVESIWGNYSSNKPLVYYVNFLNGSWCIVSGDMRFEPILAFGFSELDYDDIPDAFAMLIDEYKSQINGIITDETRDSITPNPVWELYLHNTKSYSHYQQGDTLLDKGRPDTMRLAWNQSANNDNSGCNPSYNKEFPEASSYNPLCVLYAPDECYCDHKPTGCAPVAMGQIMWYWQWPRESSYRKYHWEHMPPRIMNYTDSWEAKNISRLLRDIGDETLTVYCCNGSGTLGLMVERAFRREFGYTTVKQILPFDWRYGSVWNDLIKSEIDNARPVLFYGDDGLFTNGHYFILDGYHDGDGQILYHVNWGHGGKYQCYCKLNRMKENMNGNTHYYNMNNSAFVGISPTYTDEVIDSLTYSWVPAYRQRKEYAFRRIRVPKQDRELIIENHAQLEFEAGSEIILKPGFYARSGSEVSIHINPDWIDGMDVSLSSYPSCVNIGEEYKITTKKADSWEFSVEKRTTEDTTIIFQSAGIIRTDVTPIWNVSDEFSDGLYYGKIALKNSFGRRVDTEVVISILQGGESVCNVNYNKTYETIDTIVYGTNSCEASSAVLYPNPTNGELTVTTGDEVESIVIYTLDGRLVGGWQMLSLNDEKATLYVSDLADGTYILTVRFADGTVKATKFIKKE